MTLRSLNWMAKGFSARLMVLLLVVGLGVAGCDGFQPSEEPLPSFEELRAAYGGQPVGQGIVREDDRSPQHTAATYFIRGEEELARLRINLDGSEVVVRLRFDRISGLNIQSGFQADNVYVTYSGRCGAGGGGRLEITEMEGGTMAGVFAADVTPSSPIPAPCFLRVAGGFTAVLDTVSSLGAS